MKILLVVIVAMTLLLAACCPAPETIRVEATCVRVIDGDTIEVLIDGSTYRVRYIGIDTPEMDDPHPDVRALAEEATLANMMLVEGQTIELEKDVSETDRYGRLLRYVYVHGLFVNAELVRLGHAQVSTYPPDVKYQHLFLQMQEEAQEAGRGLWVASPASPTPFTEATCRLPKFSTMAWSPT